MIKNKWLWRRAHRGNAQMNVLIALLFAAVMGALIFYFHQAEPGFHQQVLKKLGKRMEDSAAYAHWQWQSEKKPPRIMMIHYDEQDREKSRQPIAMASVGYPRVEADDDACDKLWQVLLSEPMDADGFRVKGQYFRGEIQNSEAVNAYCRYSISSGDRFDYIIRTGKVAQ